jgi:hypothetical protein
MRNYSAGITLSTFLPNGVLAVNLPAEMANFSPVTAASCPTSYAHSITIPLFPMLALITGAKSYIGLKAASVPLAPLPTLADIATWTCRGAHADLYMLLNHN